MWGELGQVAAQGIPAEAKDVGIGAALAGMIAREVIGYLKKRKDDLSLDDMRNILKKYDDEDQTRDRMAELKLQEIQHEIGWLRGDLEHLLRRGDQYGEREKREERRAQDG